MVKEKGKLKKKKNREGRERQVEKVTNLTKGKVTVNCLGFLGDPNPVSNRSVSQIVLPSFFFFLTFFLLCYRPRLKKTVELVHAPLQW